MKLAAILESVLVQVTAALADLVKHPDEPVYQQEAREVLKTADLALRYAHTRNPAARRGNCKRR